MLSYTYEILLCLLILLFLNYVVNSKNIKNLYVAIGFKTSIGIKNHDFVDCLLRILS